MKRTDLMKIRSTYTDLVSIDLAGHKGYGAEIECEVQFTRSPVVKPTGLGGERLRPDEGGETEIASVRPFIVRTAIASGWDAQKTREYLDCPQWLTNALTECIDPDELRNTGCDD